MAARIPHDFPAAAGELGFTRTVDRDTLHRWALSEVFLTDARQVDEADYVAAAQLPSAHAYYVERASRLPVPDPLLLLECARQAETYGGHAFFGVPRDSKFLLRSWSMSLPGLLTAPVGDRPGHLLMYVRTGDRRGAVGDVRRLTYRVELAMGRHRLGRVSIDVGYIPGVVYETVRSQGRSAPLTPFGDIPYSASLLDPADVGRREPANVVLRDVRVGPDGAWADIRVPVENRSMFDHAQDHLPGMVLMEAARQLALYTSAELFGTSVPHTTPVAFDFSFTRYAELDAPTTVRILGSGNSAVPASGAGEFAGVAEVREFRVEFEQGGAAVASGRMSMATAGVLRGGRPNAKTPVRLKAEATR
jgi:hypothetical protein